LETIKSSSRKRQLVYWRNAMMYQLREKGFVLEDIGKALNRSSHSSVINAIKNVKNAKDGFNPEQLEIYKIIKSN
jgi:chromosomal replication initiation ATPase DnaA